MNPRGGSLSPPPEKMTTILKKKNLKKLLKLIQFCAFILQCQPHTYKNGHKKNIGLAKDVYQLLQTSI